MSSKGTLAAGSYTEAVAAAAAQHLDFVMGFISINPVAWKGGPGSPGEHSCRAGGIGLRSASEALLSPYSPRAR